MSKTLFGQLVIGPAGSGKTTYCHGMQQFYKELGRKTAVINLDPGNDILPYDCAVDISELITVEDVMQNIELGPNAALIYCMEFLETNLDWLKKKLEPLEEHYLVIDCPGQAELYIHHNSVKNVVECMEKWDIRLCAVQLLDSHHCTDASNFISGVLTTTWTMMHVDLPTVNVLSKIDLIEKEQKLAFSLEFYTDVLDLNYLLDQIPDDPFMEKYKKLNRALSELIQDRSLVNFVPLNIQDKENVLKVVKRIDNRNGYVSGTKEERNMDARLSTAMGVDVDYFQIANIQEKYVDNSCDMTE